MFGLSSVKDLQVNLDKLNENAKNEQTRSHIMDQLAQSIELYSCLKRYAGYCLHHFIDRVLIIILFLLFFAVQ